MGWQLIDPFLNRNIWIKAIAFTLPYKEILFLTMCWKVPLPYLYLVLCFYFQFYSNLEDRIKAFPVFPSMSIPLRNRWFSSPPWLSAFPRWTRVFRIQTSGERARPPRPSGLVLPGICWHDFLLLENSNALVCRPLFFTPSFNRSENLLKMPHLVLFALLTLREGIQKSGNNS